MQIQYNDPNSTYWKDKYKTLPNEVGPYAENKEKGPAWMRSKGLRYGGEDGGGHFWVAKNGDIYRFDDIAPGSNANTESANSYNVGNSSNYTPSGNNILNTNAVTTPLEPIMYWPNSSNAANAGNAVDNTPRANPGSGVKYPLGHVANSSGISGKFGIIDKAGLTNYGSVPMDQVNSTTNEPMTYLDDKKYPYITDDDTKSNEGETIFIDFNSGKYLGHLKDYVDNDKNYSFPKLKINIRAISRYNFNEIRQNKISIKTAEEKGYITTPLLINFAVMKDNFEKIIEREFNYDSTYHYNPKIEGTYIPPIERSLFIIYVQDENKITSEILKDDKVNLFNRAYSLDVFKCRDKTASYYIATDDYQKIAEDYFIKENGLSSPLSETWWSKEVDQKKPFKLKPNESEKLHDPVTGENHTVYPFFSKVTELRQFVICELHTHPNVSPVRSTTAFDFKGHDRSEPSMDDVEFAKKTLLPDVVFDFGITGLTLTSQTILEKIYIVTKQTGSMPGGKEFCSFLFEGKTLEDIKSKFIYNFEKVLLENIIKQYYDEPYQPK